jgi:hypothetical protein
MYLNQIMQCFNFANICSAWRLQLILWFRNLTTCSMTTISSPRYKSLSKSSPIIGSDHYIQMAWRDEVASQLFSSTSRALASPGSNPVPVVFPGTVIGNGEICSSVKKNIYRWHENEHVFNFHIIITINRSAIFASQNSKTPYVCLFRSRALFSCQKILQNFSDSPSHRIFGHMHETLNIDKK